MPKRTPKTAICVRLDEATVAQLDKAAAAEDRTRADMARRLVKLGLKQTR